ncbi:transposase [Streptomyces sp. NPDC007172]|uniref:transposase n=1 Tax=Streptomyces sp. NPDC007172 TaxID=3364776 RepID=UPI0036BF90E5
MNTRAWIVFLDESGVSLLPQVRRTYAPRGRTPLLRHRLNWKRASMAEALGYHSTDPERGARLCFHVKPGSYDTPGLIEVLEQMKVFYRGENVVLVWDGLSAHWSRAMRAWVAQQDWLTLERLPAYAPELNPVELLWSSIKKRELANLAGDHLADVADATEQGIHRINNNPQLPWSFLTHTGLTIHPPHPPNLRKDQYWVSQKSRSGQAIWGVLRFGEVGMAGQCAYPSDLADGEWAVLAPWVPPPKPGGRSPTHSPRELINALAYWLRADCAWRLLPQDFSTVADGVPLRADVADRRPLERDSRRPACPRTHRSGA